MGGSGAPVDDMWRPARRAGLVELDLDGEVLLVDTRSARQHRLNATAAAILRSADGTRTVTEVAAHAATAFGAVADEVEVQVRGVLEDLERAWVLEARAQAAPAAAMPCSGCGERAPSPAPPDPLAERDPSLPWRHTLGPYLLGARRVGVRTDLDSEADWLATVLAPLAVAVDDPTGSQHQGDEAWLSVLAAAEPPGGLHVDALGTPLVTARPARARSVLLGELAHQAVATTLGIPLHAAAVEVDGRAVVLPGRSGSGKSTLAAALVAAGWRYLGDEVAAVGPHDRAVLAHPSAIGLRPDSVALLGLDAHHLGAPDEAGRFHVDPTLLGAVAPAGSEHPLAALVFPERDERRAASLEPLAPIDAAEHLVRDVFRSRLDEQAVRAMGRLALSVPAFALRYRDATDVSELLRDLG